MGPAGGPERDAHLGVGHRALERAAKVEIINRNVASVIDPPTVEDKEIEILTGDKIESNSTPRLRIEQSIEETAEGLRFKPPKTKHGRRAVSLPPSTVDALRAHRRRVLETAGDGAGEARA